MTKLLYQTPDMVCYVGLYRNRLVVAKNMTWYKPSYWCGYAEVLPEDGINGHSLDLDFYVPGGITYNGMFNDLLEAPEISDRHYIGFDTMHPGMGDDYDLQKTMGAVCSLVDQIIEYGKQRRLKRGAV